MLYRQVAEYKQAGENKQTAVLPAEEADLSVSNVECAETRR